MAQLQTLGLFKFNGPGMAIFAQAGARPVQSFNFSPKLLKRRRGKCYKLKDSA